MSMKFKIEGKSVFIRHILLIEHPQPKLQIAGSSKVDAIKTYTEMLQR